MDYDEARRWLGVDPSASFDEIRAAYVRSVREHRPDSDPQGFQRTREAYELLSGDHAGAMRGRAAPGAVASIERATRSTPPVASAPEIPDAAGLENGRAPRAKSDAAPATSGAVTPPSKAVRATDAPLRRIEACLGLPIENELVQAVVDWFEAARREPDPDTDLDPLALDVTLRLLAAGRTDEAKRIAKYLTGPSDDARESEGKTTRRLEMRRRALAELLALEGRLTPGLYRAYATLPATGGDVEALNRELERVDPATRKRMAQEVARVAPVVHGSFVSLVSEQRAARVNRAAARVAPARDVAMIRTVVWVLAVVLGAFLPLLRCHQ
jgi:hypothetical protein